MRNPTFWIVLVIVILIAGGAYVFATQNKQMPTETPPTRDMGTTTSETTGSVTGAPVSAYTVRYTEAGFSPATLTVPKGTTVTFVNQGSGRMWVGADEHPSHTGYDGTNREEHCPNSGTAFDQCGVTGSYSFTFNKVGEWEYHNHVESDHHGRIIVTE